MAEKNNMAQQKNQTNEELVNRLQTVLSDENSSANKNTSGGIKLGKDAIILGVLVILVVISGIQTAKLAGLSSSGGSLQTQQLPSSTSSSGSGSTLPASLQNLPSQVGGC